MSCETEVKTEVIDDGAYERPKRIRKKVDLEAKCKKLIFSKLVVFFLRNNYFSWTTERSFKAKAQIHIENYVLHQVQEGNNHSLGNEVEKEIESIEK